MSRPLDHLVFACPRLDDGVAHIERLLGVRAEQGGRHEGLGTWNALVGLEGAAYLEIVSPDPQQPDPQLPRWFGLDVPSPARLVTWCARAHDLAEAIERAGRMGVDMGDVTAGTRRRPDGTELSWSFTDPRADRMGGVIPFLIDWGGSAHPSEGLSAPCAVRSLAATHPDADRVRDVVRALELEVAVEAGSAPALRADIESPAGVVRLT